MDRIELKKSLLATLCAEIDERIASEEKAVDAAQDAARNESKTSSGDMYEADVALMQLEQEKYVEQLDATLDLRKRLQNVNVTEIYSSVQVGAVAITSLGNFFIALSGEDIEIDDEEYTPISLVSPFGQELKGAKAGSVIDFRNQKVTVSEVF